MRRFSFKGPLDQQPNFQLEEHAITFWEKSVYNFQYSLKVFDMDWVSVSFILCKQSCFAQYKINYMDKGDLMDGSNQAQVTVKE